MNRPIPGCESPILGPFFAMTNAYTGNSSVSRWSFNLNRSAKRPEVAGRQVALIKAKLSQLIGHGVGPFSSRYQFLELSQIRPS